jgi:hypothetical protein
MGMTDELSVGHYFERLTMIDMTVGDVDSPLKPFADREPAPAQDGSGSAGDRHTNPSRVPGQARLGAKPPLAGCPPSQRRWPEALIVPMRHARVGEQERDGQVGP